MSFVGKARMSFKIKAVRRDSREFSYLAGFFIILNLKRLSGCGGEGHAFINRYVRSPNVTENKET
jgi:hypothetical protein